MSRRFEDWETFWFRHEILRSLDQVCPTMPRLYTAKTWDAGVVLPILLEDFHAEKDWDCYWKDRKAEVLRSQTVFSAIVCVVALEIMATYANGWPHHDILCLWFRKKTSCNSSSSLHTICLGLAVRYANFGT